MTTVSSGPSKASRGTAFGLSSKVGGESWNYVNFTTTVFAVVSTALTGCVIGHFYGLAIGAVWTLAACGMLLAMISQTTRLSAGEDRAATPAMTCNIILVGVWIAGLVALFVTGDPAAMVAATSTGWTWVSHMLIGGQRNKLVLFIVMSMLSAALLYFLISTSWTSYPFWVAIAATGSAMLMAITLVQTARIAHENFHRVGEATAEAQAMRAKLEFAIESAGDGYFEIDFQSMTYTPNPKFASSLGFEPGTHDARKLGEFVYPEDVAHVRTSVLDCWKGQSDGWNQDLRIKVVTGEYRWMSLRARVLTMGGNRRLLIGTLVDLTTRKQLESQMLAAKEAAVASAKAKGEFLANMSHEIRTPLNGVLGMAQALDAAGLGADDKEKVAVILDSGRSLMTLLNDVLDLSKIEAGKLEIAVADEDFVDAMSRTRRLFQAQADDKGLELAMRVEEGFPRRLQFDPVRVRQCISNLLSNAIKFTAAGRVEIAISTQKLERGDRLVSVKVTDTGIGMSGDAISRLFGVFEQADSSTTRRFGGSGLGLFISRQLARMMGGDIVAESCEGKGSVFTLTFTARDSAASHKASTDDLRAGSARDSLRGVKVLLTDDNAINRQVIKLFLAPHGCEITEAANGKEALDKLSSQPFDVVLLDVHMPVMDGKEAIRLIRASLDGWSGLPVIALTADAMSGDRERYMALGMTDYISKPVDQRELISKLSTSLGRNLLKTDVRTAQAV